METLTLVSNEQKVCTVTVSVEQDGYTKTSDFSFFEVPDTGMLATVALNLTYSELVINRTLAEAKNKVKLSKPFTFAIAIECGDKSMVIPDISTKISLGEKGIEKLVKHLPKVIALTTMDYTMPVAQRIKALEKCESLPLVLS